TFCDYHNMVAILEKYEHNVDFHQIVDFVEASHIRIETTNEGTKILATIDGKPRTISESSIRRNLKPKDEAGISSLPDAELFENLTLMGVNSPSFTGRTVLLFDTILVTMGEGLGTPTEPHHTPSPKTPQSPQHDLSSSIHPPVTTTTLPIIIPTDNPPLRQYSRRARIAQSSALPTAVDESASLLRDDSQGEACPTVSGLEAEHDRANIIKSSTLPHDSTPRVTSLVADKGSMQQQLNELTDLCTHLQRQQTEMASKIAARDLEIASLKARIKMLEDKHRGVAEPSRDDATIKGRSLETREEVGVDKKVATVSVPTVSGMVPTASPIYTTARVVTPYSRQKGKEKMVESDTPKKKRLQEQIDVQMTREMEEQLAK
nr:hypothetical protein [Tanacetum cinerariifolium]